MKRNKTKVVLMLVVAMLLQIVGPAAQSVYAELVEKAFTFEVDRTTGRYEWTYNPEKAEDGEREFIIDLKLTLTADFSDSLIDSETEEKVGAFTISKDGILTATIDEKAVEEQVEEPEVEEPEVEKILISDVLVKFDEDNKIIISAKITGASEDERAKVEILNEEQELVDIKENIEIKDETLEVEFENLQPGKYYAKITIGEVEELIEFVVEEVEDEDFEEEPEAGEDTKDGEGEVKDEETPLEKPSEETSFIGKTIATFASAWNNLEGSFLAQADIEGDSAEPSSGGGVIPFGLMMMPTAMEDEENEDPFFDIVSTNPNDITYEVDARISKYDGNRIEIKKGDEVDIFDGVSSIDYLVKFAIGDDFNFTGNERVEYDLPLSRLKDLELDNAAMDFGEIYFEIKDDTTGAIERIRGGSFTIENNKLIITFDKGTDLNGKYNRKGYVLLLFDVKSSSDPLDLIEEIELGGTEDKTFFIRRKNEKAKLVSKNGEYDAQKDLIYWYVDVNTVLSSLSDVNLEDTIPDGLTVTKVEIIDLKVSTTEIREVEPETWKDINFKNNPHSYTGSTLKLDLSGTDYNFDRSAKRIRITTTIASDKAGKQDFTNNVKLEGKKNGSEIEDNDNHKVPIQNRVAGISKSNSWDEKNNIITWTIEFRGDGNSYDLVDEFTLPEGGGVKLTLIDNSVKLKGSNFTGMIDKTSIGSGKITFINVPSPLTGTSKLTFQTKVIFEGKDANEKIKNNESYNIINKATYRGLEASSSISKSRGQVMEKKNGEIYIENGKTYIKWDIEINKKNESWKGIEIVEKLPSQVTFKSATMDGTAIIEDNLATDKDGNTLIRISNVTQATTVTIIAELKTGQSIPENLTNNATIKYKYNYTGTGIGGGVIIDELEEDVFAGYSHSSFNNKITKSGKINYENETVDWTVKYTTYNDNVKGLVFHDNLSGVGGEHVYTQASDFQLKLNGTVVTLSDISQSGNNNGDNSTIKLTNNSKTFEIQLANSLGNNEANQIELTYKTKFDLSSMTDITGEIELRNTIARTDGTRNENVPASVSIEKWISKNGKKSVTAKGNGIYEWTVELNPKGKTITSGTSISDVLSADNGSYQKYVGNSIKIVKAELKNKDGLTKTSPEQSIQFASSSSSKTKTTVTGETVTYDEGMTITLTEEVNTPFIITYQTEAVGLKSTEYKNKVKINLDGYLEHESKITNTITLSDYVTKELLNGRKGGDGNTRVVKGDILEWKIVVNKTLSEIYDFELTDQMEDGLIFIKDSFKVNEKPYVQEGFALNDLIGKEGFKLTKNLVDGKLEITYETLVYSTDVNIKEISNNVDLKGFELTTKKIENNKFSIIPRSQAGGVGTSGSAKDYYDVNIQKYETSEGGDKELKAVVEFELKTVTTIDGTEYIVTEKLTTDANGKLTIKDLLKTKEGDSVQINYFLKETKAPNGYVPNSGEIKEIELIPSTGGSKVVDIPFYNTSVADATGSIRFNKVDEDGAGLAGAAFTLFKEDGITLVFGEDKVFASDENGVVTITDVKSGKYKLIETSAPAEYVTGIVIDINITIDENGKTFELKDVSDLVENIVVNKKKTYAIGDYVWVDDKSDDPTTDKDGIQDPVESPLEGVRVELYEVDNAGNLKQTEGSPFKSTTTNLEGKYIFDKLPAGRYKIKFILTDEQAKEYEFTEKNNGSEVTEDSDANPVTGWTDVIVLNSTENTQLKSNTDYTDQQFTATGGIDPTWDAGVTVRERISIQGEKIWEDNDDAEGYRPDEITINLQKKVGEEWETVETRTVKVDNDWKWKFNNLYKTEFGSTEDIEYRIEEAPVMHYERSYPVGTNNVTNTFNPNKREIDVTKVWEDFSNRSGERPDSIVVKLFADGVEKGTRTLKADEGWKGIFAGLNIYQKDGATEIIYTVEEVGTSDGYLEPKITGDMAEGFAITNTRKTYAIGDYVWIDSNKDGIQNENEKPLEGVKVELFDKDKKPVKDSEGKPLVVYTDSKGKYIFDELEAGEYFVKFTLTQSQANRYTFTKQDIGDNDKDSDANPATGWTEKIILNDDNEYLTKDYDDQEFKATEGIDPTWDAGVVLIPDDPYYPPTGPGPGPGPTTPPKPTEPEKPTEEPKEEEENPETPEEGEKPEEPTETETPEEPTNPPTDVEETTPKDTPKEGEIEVPENSPEPPRVNNPPTNGTVTVDENGKWVYTPNPGFEGKDRFSIIITHPDGTEEEIFFEIDVETPLGTTEVEAGEDKDKTPALPKTGQVDSMFMYLLGILFIVAGIILRRRKTA